MLAAGVGGGALLGSALTAPKDEDTDKSDYKRTETVPIQENINSLYGVQARSSPEFNYGFTQPLCIRATNKVNQGGMADFNEGGIATFCQRWRRRSQNMEMPRANEKDVIVNAVNAIKGNMPEEQASIALAMFVKSTAKKH